MARYANMSRRLGRMYQPGCSRSERVRKVAVRAVPLLVMHTWFATECADVAAGAPAAGRHSDGPPAAGCGTWPRRAGLGRHSRSGS